MEYNEKNHITPQQVEVKHNVLAMELGSKDTDKYKIRLTNGLNRLSAPNSYEDPTYIPDPSQLGEGLVSVDLGLDSRREEKTAFVDGRVKADLAAVLQDPVIRSMNREMVEKLIEEDRKRMQKSAADLDFSEAAKYRDEMWALQEYLKVWKDK